LAAISGLLIQWPGIVQVCLTAQGDLSAPMLLARTRFSFYSIPLPAMISRYLLGLIFFVFGLNGFLDFIPQPPMAGWRPSSWVR
jgi:hypothetical protein